MRLLAQCWAGQRLGEEYGLEYGLIRFKHYIYVTLCYLAFSHSIPITTAVGLDTFLP